MEDNYDFSNAVVKDYSKEISDIEKLKIMLNAYKAATKISDEELKKEIDLILAQNMKFEWDEEKNQKWNTMQIINDEKLDVSIDWNTAVKNPYINKFTREEKLKAMLECFIAVEKINKEELKKEIDLILAQNMKF